MTNKSFKKKAFTLVELLVVISIIAILTSVTLIGLNSIRKKAQDTGHLSNLRDLQLSLETYKSINGKYPEPGTQGTTNYIVGLAPNFIAKLPLYENNNTSQRYNYSPDPTRKSYCLFALNMINNNTSQPDLVPTSAQASDSPEVIQSKTWVVCKYTF